MTFDGVLLDIDGVLAVSWEALPGAVDALARLRDEEIPFRLITNTTTKSRADLAGTLRGAGFDVADEEIVTAVVATAEHLRKAHPGAPVFVLSDGDATADLVGIDLVEVDDADVIVIGGASDPSRHLRRDAGRSAAPACEVPLYRPVPVLATRTAARRSERARTRAFAGDPSVMAHSSP